MPVDPSDRALVTVEEAARFIGATEIDLSDQDTEDTLQEFINEASDYIHLDTGREFIWVHGFYDDAETRTIPFVPGQHINVGDVLEIDELTLNGTAIVEADWDLANASGYSIYPPKILSLSPTLAYSAVTWPSAYYPSDVLTVEGTWGFEEVPPIIKRACKLIVESWWQRDVQVTSDSYDDEAGTLVSSPVATSDRTFVVPLAAEQILSKFRRLAVI